MDGGQSQSREASVSGWQRAWPGFEAAGLVAFLALPVVSAMAAGGWIWLMLHNPLVVADLVGHHAVVPVVRDLASIALAFLGQLTGW